MCVHVKCVLEKLETHRLRTEATLLLNGPQRSVINAGNILAKQVCPGICVWLGSGLSPPVGLTTKVAYES